MVTWLRIVLVSVLVVVPFTSCGGSGSTTPTTPTPTQATITATLSPNPVTSTVCSPPCQTADGRLFQWRIQGTITIQETAGVSGNINSITVTAFNPQIVFGADVIIQRSGTNHVAPKGMLIFPVVIDYGLVNNAAASRQLVLPFVVQFTDDRGNQLTAVAQWSAT